MTEEATAGQMRLLRENQATIDNVLRRVRARGGPASRWEVNLERRLAKLIGGTKVVRFHPTDDGRFVLSDFERVERDADPERELLLKEDAIAHIDQAIGNAGPDWRRST